MPCKLVNSDPRVTKTLLRVTNRCVDNTCLVLKRVSLRSTHTRRMSCLVAPHPQGWSPSDHYGWCGQSCPCCRFVVEGPGGFGACKHCEEQERTQVPTDAKVEIVDTRADEDGRSMHLISWIARASDDAASALYHTGWVYAKNVRRSRTFMTPGVPNDTSVTVVSRDKDENHVDMYKVRVAPPFNNMVGWVYPKNVYDSAAECAVCMDVLARGEDVLTRKCSHQFHRRCLERWYATGGDHRCPVCRRD